VVKPDIIAAVATAPGRAAIGIVRLSGPELMGLMPGLFGRVLLPRQATVTHFLDSQGSPIDSGIGIFFQAPQSYTGEDVLELHGHGGSGVLKLVLGRCIEVGARLAEPGEFTRRAFLNGKIDLAQAEAVADLIEASSEAAARAAVRSLTGAFSSAVNDLRSALLELRTRVEAQIDFPEENVEEVEQAALQRQLAEVAQRARDLLSRAVQGQRLRDGAKVAIIGAPNVGKSTLLNYLAGADIAIVTNVPGTTRDAISVDVAIGGVPITVVDTAGIRETDDPIEKIGMARALDAANNADLILHIRDLMDCTADEPALQRRLPDDVRRITVFNKIDLVNVNGNIGIRDKNIVRISAKTGQGVEELCHTILEHLGMNVSEDANFMARERHVQALNEAILCIEAASKHDGPPELVAEELRVANISLGKITGQVSADALLGNIFSKFCIGK
jgi:tRNA modification GTPase